MRLDKKGRKEKNQNMSYPRVVWLIGMPASGKTTLCRHMQGTDTDYVLGLQKAFQECKTPDEFYDRECEAVVKYVQSNPKGVVATGGSVVHREEAMEAIVRSGAIVVFLDAPLHVLKERLGDWSSRGIVLPDGIEDLDALYAFRRPLYEKWANLTLDTSVYSLESCVQTIEWLFG